jgi:hypothetical protein
MHARILGIESPDMRLESMDPRVCEIESPDYLALGVEPNIR